jgi:hypothetical protein
VAAPSLGLGSIEVAHNSTQPKTQLVNLLVEKAAKEGTGWGCWRYDRVIWRGDAILSYIARGRDDAMPPPPSVSPRRTRTIADTHSRPLNPLFHRFRWPNRPHTKH